MRHLKPLILMGFGSLSFTPSSVSAATFLEMIHEDTLITGGSFGSCCGFDPSLGAPGLVFDVLEDFSIEAVSYAIKPNLSSLNYDTIRSTVTVSIESGPNSGDSLTTTADAARSGDFFERKGNVFEWVDIPINYNFLAGNTYSVQFPFWEYYIPDYPDASAWESFFYYVYGAFPATGGPSFDAESVLTVTSATLVGNYQGTPLMGFLSSSDNIAGVDRTFGYTGKTPSAIPLPASLPLLLGGFGTLGLMRRKRKAA